MSQAFPTFQPYHSSIIKEHQRNTKGGLKEHQNLLMHRLQQTVGNLRIPEPDEIILHGTITEDADAAVPNDAFVDDGCVKGKISSKLVIAFIVYMQFVRKNTKII